LNVNTFLFALAGVAVFLWALTSPEEPLHSLALRASKWVLAASVIVGAVAIVYFRAAPSASLNYKLSVDVDDNGVLRHGEGIIGAEFQAQPILIGQTPPWTVGPIGEAFPVDFDGKRMFFVLLSADRSRRSSVAAGSKGALYSYFHFRSIDAATASVLAEFISLGQSHENVDIRPVQLPMLVRFRDLTDPKSIEIVDPEHLDLGFGPGVKITAVRAQITSEPITSGIGIRLPWLKNGDYGTRIFEAKGGPVYQIPQVRMTTYGSFATSSFWQAR